MTESQLSYGMKYPAVPSWLTMGLVKAQGSSLAPTCRGCLLLMSGKRVAIIAVCLMGLMDRLLLMPEPSKEWVLDRYIQRINR